MLGGRVRLGGLAAVGRGALGQVVPWGRTGGVGRAVGLEQAAGQAVATGRAVVSRVPMPDRTAAPGQMVRAPLAVPARAVLGQAVLGRPMEPAGADPVAAG